MSKPPCPPYTAASRTASSPLPAHTITTVPAACRLPRGARLAPGQTASRSPAAQWQPQYLLPGNASILRHYMAEASAGKERRPLSFNRPLNAALMERMQAQVQWPRSFAHARLVGGSGGGERVAAAGLDFFVGSNGSGLPLHHVRGAAHATRTTRGGSGAPTPDAHATCSSLARPPAPFPYARTHTLSLRTHARTHRRGRYVSPPPLRSTTQHGAVWNALLWGRKVWAAVPPSEAAFAPSGEHPLDSSWWRHYRDGRGSALGEIRVRRPPRKAKATQRKRRAAAPRAWQFCEQSPGTAIFLPSQWAHATLALEESLGVGGFLHDAGGLGLHMQLLHAPRGIGSLQTAALQHDAWYDLVARAFPERGTGK